MGISYDKDFLLIKARVKDTHFKDGNRAWRYGDGFFINIAAPKNLTEAYTNRYYAYGFCLEKGKPISTLIMKVIHPKRPNVVKWLSRVLMLW